MEVLTEDFNLKIGASGLAHLTDTQAELDEEQAEQLIVASS